MIFMRPTCKRERTHKKRWMRAKFWWGEFTTLILLASHLWVFFTSWMTPSTLASIGLHVNTQCEVFRIYLSWNTGHFYTFLSSCMKNIFAFSETEFEHPPLCPKFVDPPLPTDRGGSMSVSDQLHTYPSPNSQQSTDNKLGSMLG